MITITKQLSQKEIIEAKNYQNLRDRCKTYLAKHDVCFDKFTINRYDAYISYVTEKFIANYLREKYQGKVCVSMWSDQFNLEQIDAIITQDSDDPLDVSLVQEYFYDEFDLYLSTPRTQSFISLKIDVKTAITKNSPNNNWEFLYPVIQANKAGKDRVVLVYYIAEDCNDPSTLKEVCIIGHIDEDSISNCEVLPAGSTTRHHTVSQIDNYITHISEYEDIDNMLSI